MDFPLPCYFSGGKGLVTYLQMATRVPCKPQVASDILDFASSMLETQKVSPKTYILRTNAQKRIQEITILRYPEIGWGLEPNP